MFVTTNTLGERRENLGLSFTPGEIANSSPSQTKYFPSLLNFPGVFRGKILPTPIANDGARLALSRRCAIKEEVVLLPPTPHTQIVSLPCESMAKASAWVITGIPRLPAAKTSGLLRPPCAPVVINKLHSLSIFFPEKPTFHLIFLFARISSVTNTSFVSLPVTFVPSSSKQRASDVIPTPFIPVKCTSFRLSKSNPLSTVLTFPLRASATAS